MSAMNESHSTWHYPLDGCSISSGDFKTNSAVSHRSIHIAEKMEIQKPPSMCNGSSMYQITDRNHPVLKDQFERILSIVCPGKSQGLKRVEDWMRKMIRETMADGKFTRGLLFLHTYQDLNKKITEDQLKSAAVLAWLIEMFHTVGLILDDIMDRSSKRRGKLCWHKRNDVNMMAVNDAVLLEQCFYKVLYEEFGETEKSHRLERCMRLTSFSTVQGQCLDLLCERDRSHDPLVYDELIRIKTSLYTFLLPMKLALILADVNDTKLEADIERVVYKIGRLFQIRDDFLDCFEDLEKSGKDGSDIINGKCTWLWVTAMQVADADQKKLLLENYGQGEKRGVEETTVINIYKQLGMEDRVRKDMETIRGEIDDLIALSSFPFGSFEVILKKLS